MVESGIFYSSVVDPLLKSLRKKVTLEIGKNHSVLDVACGTGAQVFELARVSQKVYGIDLSKSMIEYAMKVKKANEVNNAEFFICDATDLSIFKPGTFDYAIMSLALHQFSPELHSPVLTEMKKVASKIVLVDYAVPLPLNYTGIGSRVAEFLAGIEHNRNFRKYYKKGGLKNILAENGLKIQKTVFMARGAFQMVVCSE